MRVRSPVETRSERACGSRQRRCAKQLLHRIAAARNVTKLPHSALRNALRNTDFVALAQRRSNKCPQPSVCDTITTDLGRLSFSVADTVCSITLHDGDEIVVDSWVEQQRCRNPLFVAYDNATKRAPPSTMFYCPECRCMVQSRACSRTTCGTARVGTCGQCSTPLSKPITRTSFLQKIMGEIE